MSLNQGYRYREEVQRPEGETALSYLAGRYRHSTPDEWAARFARREIELDGVTATGEERLRPGQELCWHRPPWEEPEVPRTFEVVYEDPHIVAVCKPSGLPTLPAGGFLENTLLALARARWPGAIPLHRLGRATSGLVLLARSPEAAAPFFRLFRERKVHKRYRALAAGLPSKDSFRIDAPIGLLPHPRLGSVYGARADGKPALSHARVLERRERDTLFEVEIHTGRPEQIRSHLAFIGHPLVGDPLFGPGGVPREDAPGLPGDGGYHLHAEALSLVHPATGAPLELFAPPPPLLQLGPR